MCSSNFFSVLVLMEPSHFCDVTYVSMIGYVPSLQNNILMPNGGVLKMGGTTKSSKSK